MGTFSVSTVVSTPGVAVISTGWKSHKLPLLFQYKALSHFWVCVLGSTHSLNAYSVLADFQSATASLLCIQAYPIDFFFSPLLSAVATTI